MGFDGRWINLVMQCSYEQSGLLTGCKIARGALVISHMLFADDSYIYCKATEEEAYNVKEFLHTYEVASGQKINFSKSSVFFNNNTGIEVQDSIYAMLEIYEADENGYYLGLPCSIGRNKNDILGFLKDKLRKIIQGWEGRILSRAGNEVFLKSIAQVLPSYAMNVFLLPSDTCKELERLMAKFWWRSDSSSGKGGLGFRSLRDFNLALLGKQYWRLLVNADSLVSRLYKAKYYATGNLFTAGLVDNPSFIWRSILEAKDLIHACAQRTIDNGKNVSILNDFWLPHDSNSYVVSRHPALVNKSVSCLFQVGTRAWDEDVVRGLTETIQHTLVECSVAKAAWHRSIVEVGAGAATFSSWLLGIFTRGHGVEMEEAVMVSWATWRARNDFVWQKKSWLASNIVTSARILLYQYKFTQERKGLSLSPLNDEGRNYERWIAPVLNKIKVNVDGALFEQEGRFGMGCVARDHHRTMVEAFTKGKVGYVQPEIAEIVGIKEALIWIATHPSDNVVLETDSLMCVQAVQSCVLKLEDCSSEVRSIV
ncbi:uncharacterized protein LOC115713156 [Cannabis sativa]|uniref:uncharacterized protein LOC115713156 n=1 Tax=Cannabis sativa TaxID=3483 RepID=UPI0029C9E387|nr:uncharacterized protein LOC115713156 [Cannabis sativa]